MRGPRKRAVACSHNSGRDFGDALRGGAGPIEHDAAESLQLAAVAEIEQFVLVAAVQSLMSASRRACRISPGH